MTKVAAIKERVKMALASFSFLLSDSWPPDFFNFIKFTVLRAIIRGAFGKFLAWSFISVTDLQNLSCLVSF